MKFIYFLFSVMSLCFIACSPKTMQTEMLSQDSSFNKITIEPVKQSKEFPDATLAINQVVSAKVSPDSASFNISYLLSHFQLTQMTMDMNMEDCANSGNGQHIHFILDNKPYVALYKPGNAIKLALNSEHYLLSFLSRSYHESVKNSAASVLIHFKIDENGNYIKLPNPTSPMLFYSRPKGEYTGKDTENVLLDFYLFNTDLTDNKVKLSVNDRSFIIKKWQPYFLKNVPIGKINFKLELVDNKGNLLSGSNTSVTRAVTLK